MGPIICRKLRCCLVVSNILFAASLLATKPSFWLNEGGSRCLTLGFRSHGREKRPRFSNHQRILKQTAAQGQTFCAGVDGWGTHKDSLDMFELSLKFKPLQDSSSPKQ